jgi:hypothetical protein
MNRYASGLPVGGIKEAIWDEDAETSAGINPKTLDLVDFQTLKLDNDILINDLKEQINTVKNKPKAKTELSEEAESTNLT